MSYYKIDESPFLDYVCSKWISFFGFYPPPDEIDCLIKHVTEFKLIGETLENAFQYITSHPELLNYKKNQVGEGEFALYILLSDARKISSKNTMGDIAVFGNKYEIKKIKRANEAIRFGTNHDLQPIDDLRLALLSIKELISNDVDDECRKKARHKYDEIMDGSEASITMSKLQKFYEFFIELLNHVTSHEFHDYLFSVKDELIKIIHRFIKKYPDVIKFGESVVTELKEKYINENVQILIIDDENSFRLNPDFNYNSINQYIRPQVTLKK
jgi:hypothetical protein